MYIGYSSSVILVFLFGFFPFRIMEDHSMNNLKNNVYMAVISDFQNGRRKIIVWPYFCLLKP